MTAGEEALSLVSYRQALGDGVWLAVLVCTVSAGDFPRGHSSVMQKALTFLLRAGCGGLVLTINRDCHFSPVVE